MKKLVLAMAFIAIGIGSAHARPFGPFDRVADPVITHGHTTGAQKAGALGVLLVMAHAVTVSNAQGVLSCHSRPDVKIDRGGYNVMATDCEVNGFN